MFSLDRVVADHEDQKSDGECSDREPALYSRDRQFDVLQQRRERLTSAFVCVGTRKTSCSEKAMKKK